MNTKTMIIAVIAIVLLVAGGVYVLTTSEDKPSSIMVYSGAGMRKPMDELGVLFEQKHDIAVEYNYAGSNTLLSQMELTQQGDVYMPGAHLYIEKAIEKGFVDYTQNIAYHEMIIAVPEGNPANITCLSDLAKPGIRVVLSDPDAASSGKDAQEILDKNGLREAVYANVIARTATVNELVVYISMEQADASLIYRASLCGTEDETDMVEIPQEQNILPIIPIGQLTFSQNPKYAKMFVDFVASDEGKAIFEEYCFTKCPD
jgi:molybdate transport system substrate-binding protein